MTTNPTGLGTHNPKAYQSSFARVQVSQYTEGEVGIQTLHRGQPKDPDEGSLKLSITRFDEANSSVTGDETIVPNSEIEKVATGQYRAWIPASLTEVPGSLQLRWSYTFSNTPGSLVSYVDVLNYMPTYVQLSEDEKFVVTMVQNMFGDLYDNTVGGDPHFAEEFQTQYTYERIAQMMMLATQNINSSSQPFTYFTVGSSNAGGKPFPVQGYGLLIKATYVEVLKHFMRSYVEQPVISGPGVTLADRRDYLQRWQTILQMELDDLKNMTRMFKRKQLNLGSSNLIVAGGIYGGGGTFRSGQWAMETRGARFYPVANMVVMR